MGKPHISPELGLSGPNVSLGSKKGIIRPRVMDFSPHASTIFMVYFQISNGVCWPSLDALFLDGNEIVTSNHTWAPSLRRLLLPRESDLEPPLSYLSTILFIPKFFARRS